MKHNRGVPFEHPNCETFQIGLVAARGELPSFLPYGNSSTTVSWSATVVTSSKMLEAREIKDINEMFKITALKRVRIYF